MSPPSPKGPMGSLSIRVAYTICSDGTIGVKWALDFSKSGIVLPRISQGLSGPVSSVLRLRPGADGELPGSQARQLSGSMRSTVEKEVTPYLVPMELGNHEGVSSRR